MQERSIPLTYPGNYSPVEAGQLGVVVGNLLFDDPGGGQKDGLKDRRDGLSNQENTGGGEAESSVQGGGVSLSCTVYTIINKSYFPQTSSVAAMTQVTEAATVTTAICTCHA